MPFSDKGRPSRMHERAVVSFTRGWVPVTAGGLQSNLRSQRARSGAPMRPFESSCGWSLTALGLPRVVEWLMRGGHESDHDAFNGDGKAPDVTQPKKAAPVAGYAPGSGNTEKTMNATAQFPNQAANVEFERLAHNRKDWNEAAARCRGVRQHFPDEAKGYSLASEILIAAGVMR
jgi:hypothetical protein